MSGHVERLRRGLMPNGTIPRLPSMRPKPLLGRALETQIIDEYVQTDCGYLQQLIQTDIARIDSAPQRFALDKPERWN